MWSRYVHIFFVHPGIQSLFILAATIGLLTACQSNEPGVGGVNHSVGFNEMIVFETDTTEWRVCVFAEHLLYAKAVQVALPAPWGLPTREDAAMLRLLDYPHEERFVTSDGYTFAMPSASVSKAGAKTKYSVLGLFKRKTVIEVGF